MMLILEDGLSWITRLLVWAPLAPESKSDGPGRPRASLAGGTRSNLGVKISDRTHT